MAALVTSLLINFNFGVVSCIEVFFYLHFFASDKPTLSDAAVASLCYLVGWWIALPKVTLSDRKTQDPTLFARGACAGLAGFICAAAVLLALRAVDLWDAS